MTISSLIVHLLQTCKADLVIRDGRGRDLHVWWSEEKKIVYLSGLKPNHVRDIEEVK